MPGDVEQWAQLRNITLRNIQVSNVVQLIAAANIPTQQPARNLVFFNLTGTCGKAINLANIADVTFSAINVTGFKGPLFTGQNVTGTSLDNPASPDKSSNTR